MSDRNVFQDTSRVVRDGNPDGTVFRVVMLKQDKTTRQMVEVRDSKPLVIKAAHAYEAIERYKYASGIIATENQFDASPVDEGDPLFETAKEYPLRPKDVPAITGFNDSLPRQQFVTGVENLGTIAL